MGHGSLVTYNALQAYRLLLFDDLLFDDLYGRQFVIISD
jgi:hypothetical protein